MASSDDVWAWIVRGFGRIVGMIQAQHEDKTSGPCPYQELAWLKNYHAILEKVIEDQSDGRIFGVPESPTGVTAAITPEAP